jgi:hypothetical protein
MYLSTCFWDTEECKDKRNQSECRKEDVCAPGNVVKHVRSDQANYAEKNVRTDRITELV